MKKAFLLMSFVVGVFFMSFTTTTKAKPVTIEATTVSDYCSGWEDGYCEGWKDVKGQYSVCPVTPVCPVSKVDCYEGYKCGYNRGFKAGMSAARN